MPPDIRATQIELLRNNTKLEVGSREVDLRGLRRRSWSDYVQIPLHQILELFIKIVSKLRKMKV